LLGTRTAYAYAHARLAGVSREPILGVCTQLCLGQNCQAVGTGIGGNAIRDLLKSKKALAHHRALAVMTNMVPA